MRRLRHHDEVPFVERHASSNGTITEKEKMALRKLCKRLVTYSSAQVLSTQLVALDEIVALTIEDPVIRMTLKEFDLNLLSPKYSEPDLIISTSKALGSLENARVHDLWSSVVSSRGRCFFEDVSRFADYFRLICASLYERETSYLAARYLFHISKTKFKDPTLRQFQSQIWLRYVIVALYCPQIVEWQNMERCLGIRISERREHLRYSNTLISHFKQFEQHYPESFARYFREQKWRF